MNGRSENKEWNGKEEEQMSYFRLRNHTVVTELKRQTEVSLGKRIKSQTDFYKTRKGTKGRVR